MFDGDFEPQSASSYGLPITFTGQRLDILDGGDLEIMYYKNRFYDNETGRIKNAAWAKSRILQN